MSVIQARHAATEALYDAIREEVGRVDQYADRAGVLETLAHAYSMVAEPAHPEPGKEAVKAVLG